MQTLAWEVLLRAIPEQYYNTLSIITRAGIEITVQTLLRIEPECVAIRGRLSGSQDAGRVFFIPYEQIDHIGFLREMKEAEFAEIFAPLKFPDRPTTARASVAAADGEALPELEAIVPEGEEPALTPTTSGSRVPSRMSLPIKSEVLERFRSRTASSPGNGTLPGTGGTENGTS